MGYEVLARKWRPQQFSDVVGQDHVTQTLTNAIKNDRIAHAYLFVGPRGIGKTSIARIFAKALNCREGNGADPCDKCDTCREIMAGSSLDVMEIDGASNNGVDQVRDLRETVKYAPVRGKYKIYIIDEVHMLSKGAFNALLKTLEEPPPHVKFMFATTEPDKILSTIVSRCQRFDLRRIPVSLIMERLKVIAKEEKVAIDDDAVLAIARGAEGGLRDAESALDQLISFKGNTIKEADVLSVFGLVARQTLEALAGAVLEGDIGLVVNSISELDEAGKDLKRVVAELMEYFRNLLVFMNVKEGVVSLDVSEAQLDVLKEQSKLTDTGRLLRIVKVLSETDERMRFALSRRTLLETALIRCCRAATTVSLDQLLKRISEIKGGAGYVSEAASAGAVRAPVQPVQKAAESSYSAPVPARPQVVREKATVEDELQILRDRWEEVTDRVGKLAMLARGILVDAAPVSVTENTVVIAFEPEFSGEVASFDSGRNLKAVERALEGVLGRRVRAEFTVARTGSKAAVEIEAVVEEESETRKSETARMDGDWMKNPAVQKTLEMFDGSVVDIRE